MENKDFNKIMNEYFSFKERLINKIKNKTISLNNEDCYLINESWNNKYEYCYKAYNKIEEQNKNFQFNIPFDENPEFINNFNTITYYIKNDKKFKLISKNIIDFFILKII